MRLALVPALAALLATGCATGGVSRADMKTSIQIQYGRVDEVEKVAVDSNAGGSAILGGIIGAVVDRKHRLAGAAIGAGAAGAATYLAEGSHEAFAYTIRMDSGQMTKVIVGHGDIAVGQCVALEQGRTANVRVVSAGHCRSDNVAAAAAAAADPEIQARAQDHAAACDRAKEAVLAAETPDAVDLAARKARIVCGH
jgi:outer membrane lipoprotein SlyB